jgi:hypothetical protein
LTSCALRRTFQFFGPSDTPALVDPPRRVGGDRPGGPARQGDDGSSDRPGQFLGAIAPAVSTISFSADEIGFEFEANKGVSTSPRGFAEIESERNGVFLT